MAAKSLASALVYHAPTFLEIVVSENGARLMRDRMKIPKLEERALKRLSIPGFGTAQIQELVVTKKTEYRHLGLFYQITAAEEKMSW